MSRVAGSTTSKVEPEMEVVFHLPLMRPPLGRSFLFLMSARVFFWEAMMARSVGQLRIEYSG